MNKQQQDYIRKQNKIRTKEGAPIPRAGSPEASLVTLLNAEPAQIGERLKELSEHELRLFRQYETRGPDRVEVQQLILDERRRRNPPEPVGSPEPDAEADTKASSAGKQPAGKSKE